MVEVVTVGHHPQNTFSIVLKIIRANLQIKPLCINYIQMHMYYSHPKSRIRGTMMNRNIQSCLKECETGVI